MLISALTGVLYGTCLWAIVRLLASSRSKTALVIGAIAGLVVLVLTLLGGAYYWVGVLLVTASCAKSLTKFDVGLTVSMLASGTAAFSAFVVRLLVLMS